MGRVVPAHRRWLESLRVEVMLPGEAGDISWGW